MELEWSHTIYLLTYCKTVRKERCTLASVNLKDYPLAMGELFGFPGKKKGDENRERGTWRACPPPNGSGTCPVEAPADQLEILRVFIYTVEHTLSPALTDQHALPAVTHF